MTPRARWGTAAEAGPHTVHAAGGTRLTYRSRWTELELLGPDGTVDATISATAYVVAGRRRPVTFLWNGGPGASSSPLHLQAFGPRILVDGAPRPNPHTLLAETDLVFVDPPGTGFSRTASDAARARLYTVPGDAAAMEAFVRHWLTTHAAPDTPVHLVAESYGGYRLAALAPWVTDLPIAGITLISPMLDRASGSGSGNDLRHVFTLPTMAAGAWAHGLASTAIADVATVWAQAERFAVGELLSALYLGSALPEQRRDRLAERIAQLLAIPVPSVIAADLRVDSEDFLRTVRAGDGLLAGRLDVRVTGPMPDPPPDGRPPAADDPALGIGRGNVIHSAPIAGYLQSDLGVDAGGPYVSLSLDVNFAWDWDAQADEPALAPNLGAFVAARPATRVLLIGGYFDLSTTLASTIHAVRHSGVPPENLEIVRLAAGHSIDAAVLPTARAAVARAITAAET